MIRYLLERQKHPEKTAVIEGDREVSYAQLLEAAREVMQALPSGRANTALLLPNGSGYIAALWGALMAGHTALPLNCLMTGHEILPLLRQASIKTVITAEAYLHIFKGTQEFEVILVDGPAPALLRRGHTDADTGGPALPPADADTYPMLLFATSGTTGRSKIVALSEKNIKTSVLGYLDKLRFDVPDIRYTLAVPFSCAYGMMIITVCLMKSFPLVVLHNDFTLPSLYRAAQKQRITHYEGSATAILIMERMAGRKIPYDIRTLRYFGFGGSKVSGETIKNIQTAYPDMEFYQGYGMTEASPLIAKHPQKKLEKFGSVGTAIKGVEVAVESGGGIVTTAQARGEIVVRGENVMLGYLCGAGADAQGAVKNGYLYTGDIGYLDEDGYLYICGRKKNIIIVRGFNVYPEEVESCIQNSRLAQDCLVYGESCGDGREILCADIVPVNANVSEEDVRAYLCTHLAEYKRPQKITLRASISKNASGKSKRG